MTVIALVVLFHYNQQFIAVTSHYNYVVEVFSEDIPCFGMIVEQVALGCCLTGFSKVVSCLVSHILRTSSWFVSMVSGICFRLYLLVLGCMERDGL